MPNIANKLIDYLKEQKSIYKTNHLMVTFGDDFSYYYADQNFNFISKIMKAVNEKTNEF